jgi:hypothetical protein
MTPSKILSTLLGISVFIFGFLKFFNPFKEWYATQISESGLPEKSYAMGIAGELIAGAMLLSVVMFPTLWNKKATLVVSTLSSFVIVVMMIVATYVHVHPNVPESVLPLKIKPPVIPLLFILLALINGFFVFNNRSRVRGNK